MWRLQTGKDADCLFFQSFADQAHYTAPGGTRQGIYVCTPAGKLLASANTLDAGKLGAILRDSLAAWARLEEAGEIGTNAVPIPADRWESRRPKDGLVLRCVSRDLPDRFAKDMTHVGSWNRDHVWLSGEEARAIVPSPATPGSAHDVRQSLVERLARFHLVDNVLGQTLPFAPEEIRQAGLAVRVTGRSEDVIELALEGSAEAVSEGKWLLGDNPWKTDGVYPRGVSVRMLGSAAYNTKRSAFTRFDLIAIGQRWGYTENNGRRRDADRSPVGFLFTLAPEDGAGRVPPAFIDIYDAPWMRGGNAGDLPGS